MLIGNYYNVVSQFNVSIINPFLMGNSFLYVALLPQELDEKRIKNMRNYMMKSVEIERAVAPIIAQCLDGIEKAANEINEKEDTMLVIERYKSGFQPPGDFPFEDLSVAKNYESNSQLAQPVMQPIHNHLTVKGTVSGGKIKKRVGLFGIFGSNKVDTRPLLWKIVAILLRSLVYILSA